MIAAAIISLSFSFWLLRGKFTPVKQTILSRISLPIALINYQPIFSQDYFFRYQLALKYLNPDLDVAETQTLQKTVYQETVKEEITRQLASGYNIAISPQRLDREYTLIKNQQPDVIALFNNLSEETYKEKILKPYLLDTELKIWFNRQKQLNQQAYSKIEDFQKQLNSGAKFEDLSKYSQDKTSAETFGDLGFVEPTTLLPEILEIVDEMRYDETRIVASRFGLHLIQLLEKDNQGSNNSARIHLRQIFIPASSFDQWYENESKNFKIIKIIKIWKKWKLKSSII